MSGADQPNPEQRAAVEAGDGPLLIIAGPGTGKTKTLTARIAYLVETGRVKPEAILALTFTNKAAEEMQARVATRLDKGGKSAGQKPTVATFHALAHQLLVLPKKSTLLGDIEHIALLQMLKKTKAGKGLSIRDISLTISRAKNQLHTPPEPDIKVLLDTYNAELHTRNMYDYDDLLLWLHEALQQGKLRQKTRRYQHILVDEFQDTNELQYEILKLLNSTDNLFVIGDPLQSIYGFRGANAEIFDRFRKDFPQTAHVQLVTNYRSAPEIVRLAGAIFPAAPALRAHRHSAGKTQSLEVLNEYGEADWIINDIEGQVGGSDMLRASRHHNADKQRTFSDFAIMSRTHAIAKTIQAALETSGIPYQVAGEGSPYLRPYATVIIQSFSYLVGLSEAPATPTLTSAQIARLLDPLKKIMHDVPLTQLAQKIIETLSVSTDKNTSDVRQFTNALLRYDDMPPADYVAHVEKLAQQEYYDPAAGVVTVLTIHAAKGLEFPVVFIIGAEEGTLPLSRKGVVSDIEEEKRLFYVAITRARDELHMLHAKSRKGKPQQVSSFISDLPRGTIHNLIDPAIPGQVQKLKRRAQKRAQGSLF